MTNIDTSDDDATLRNGSILMEKHDGTISRSNDKHPHSDGLFSRDGVGISNSSSGGAISEDRQGITQSSVRNANNSFLGGDRLNADKGSDSGNKKQSQNGSDSNGTVTSHRKRIKEKQTAENRSKGKTQPSNKNNNNHGIAIPDTSPTTLPSVTDKNRNSNPTKSQPTTKTIISHNSQHTTPSVHRTTKLYLYPWVEDVGPLHPASTLHPRKHQKDPWDHRTNKKNESTRKFHSSIFPSVPGDGQTNHNVDKNKIRNGEKMGR